MLKTLLDILTTIFLHCRSNNSYSVVTGLVYIAGLWGIFRKCGITPWHALIPCLREIRTGEAAGREKEGRVAALLDLVLILKGLFELAVDTSYEAGNILYFFSTFLSFAIGFAVLIYNVRLGLGLVEVFDRKKRWVILWAVFEWIPAILWGWMEKYRPLWKAGEMKNTAADYFSGSRAAVLDQGLTVNLEERTATEFFKKKYLLRDIHMYIRPGHMVLLLGGSGAGKTTYINAVNGYEKAKAEVVLNGRNMYREYKDMKYDIGFVPQQDLMRGSDGVYRTLMDAAALRLPASFTKAELEARVNEVMDIFGLTPVKNNLVVKLSGGQRKRLSIAMEFLSNPSLFILDEPDSGLDGVMARELFEQLRQIADQGKIIIVITHTPDRVIDLFDDVIVLAKDSNRTGRLAWFGPIDEAREFFGKEKMEEIVKSVNREEEGGEGRADEFIRKFAMKGAVQHA